MEGNPMKPALLLLLLSSVAQAGFHFKTPKEQWTKLDIPTLAIYALPVMYGQLVLHETSHALFALATGASVQLTPYPYSDGQYFYFASTAATWPGNGTGWKTNLEMAATAQILDVIVVLGLFVLDNLVELPPWLHTVLKVWQIACLIDFTTNMVGLWRPGTNLDQNDFRDVYYGLLGMQPAVARGITALVDGGLAATILCF
jgi:hypothetical protein